MARSYDISKKSDLRRFFKDLDAAVMGSVEESVSNQLGNVCPNCGEPLRIHVGTTVCVHCGTSIEFTVE